MQTASRKFKRRRGTERTYHSTFQPSKMQELESVAALSLNELNELSDIGSMHFANTWSDINSKHFELGKHGSGLRKKIDVSCMSVHRTLSAPNTLEHSSHCCAPEKELGAQRRPSLNVATWNIAAPNNNPFEFWVSHQNEEYNELMLAIQKHIDQPKTFESKIGQIFTPCMYAELRNELALQGVSGLEKLDVVWTRDLMHRMTISEFLKDRSFGEKRLISMPDRITSSITIKNGLTVFRPSPITGIQNDMDSIKAWWSLWTTYMFKTAPNIEGKEKKSVVSLLDMIARAKYPALSEAEEEISIPLQILCLALFDAVYIHLLATVAPKTWQPLKRSLHAALFEHKAARCVSILQTQYGDADVIFIQEASEAFASRAGVCLDHFVLRPSGVDGRRSQLSLILARKSLFLRHTARDMTEEVLRRLPSKCTTAGDLCVFELASHEGPYLLASFHGDSDGACTAPVLSALHGLARERFPNHTLLFGLDANTAAGPACSGDQKQNSSLLTGLGAHSAGAESCAGSKRVQTNGGAAGLDGGGFCALLGERGLGSCWDGQDLRGLWTTFNARTYLQPQLHKAVGLEGVLDRRHMRLRDWVVFRAGQLAVAGVERDNTGVRGCFLPRAMPSEGFPSDHSIVWATLRCADPQPLAVAACRAALRRGSTTALP